MLREAVKQEQDTPAMHTYSFILRLKQQNVKYFSPAYRKKVPK